MTPEKIRKLIFALAIAGISVFIVYMLLQQKKMQELPPQDVKQSQGNDYQVLVAKTEVPPGSTVQNDMVSVVTLPEKFIQPGAIFSLEEVEKKITIAPILKGEQILSTKFGTSYEKGGSLALKTPPGKRAITVDIDPIAAVGGMARRGDNVDILGTFVLDAKEGGPMTVTLFQNVLILDVRFGGGGDKKKGEEDNGAVPGTITFALSPQEAELFLFAKQQGKVHLGLRAPLDAQVQEIPPANWLALFRHIAPAEVTRQLEQAAAVPEEAKSPVQPEIFKGFNKQ